MKSKLIFETVCYKEDSYPIYVTYVKNKNGKLITRGNGKGIEKQSYLSSLFEGIEHSFYESYVLKNIISFKKGRILIKFKNNWKNGEVLF